MVKIRIKNNTEPTWECEGFVEQTVVDKINNKEFVEFNLHLEDDTAEYQRFHYSPVKDMEVEIL